MGEIDDDIMVLERRENSRIIDRRYIVDGHEGAQFPRGNVATRVAVLESQVEYGCDGNVVIGCEPRVPVSRAVVRSVFHRQIVPWTGAPRLPYLQQQSKTFLPVHPVREVHCDRIRLAPECIDLVVDVIIYEFGILNRDGIMCGDPTVSGVVLGPYVYGEIALGTSDSDVRTIGPRTNVGPAPVPIRYVIPLDTGCRSKVLESAPVHIQGLVGAVPRIVLHLDDRRRGRGSMKIDEDVIRDGVPYIERMVLSPGIYRVHPFCRKRDDVGSLTRPEIIGRNDGLVDVRRAPLCSDPCTSRSFEIMHLEPVKSSLEIQAYRVFSVCPTAPVTLPVDVVYIQSEPIVRATFERVYLRIWAEDGTVVDG